MDYQKSIEILENNFWKEVSGDCSYVTREIYILRKKPIKNLEIEDIRLLISQNIGVNFILPISLEILESNILAEGDYYPGDLLKSVLSISKQYWFQNPEWKAQLIAILKKNINIIENADLSEEIKKEIKILLKNIINI